MRYECHGHISLDGADYKAAVEAHRGGVNETLLRENLSALKERGVGFFRDGGDKLSVSELAKRLAPEYGIDYRTPVYAIHKRGCYGGMFGPAFESVSELKALISGAKARGADFIKLMASGIMDYDNGGGVSGPALSLSELSDAVHIAADCGLNVMAHVNGAENIKNALKAGVKSVEHGFHPDEDVIELFLETGAVWVPTRAPLENLIGCGRFDDGVLRRVLIEQGEVLKRAYASGVSIASGSDSGSFLVPQGTGTVSEYGYLEALGIDSEAGNKEIAELFKAAK